MLRLICLPRGPGEVHREEVHAVIHKMLPTEYHHKGVATSQNKDPVKSHTFIAPIGVPITPFVPFHMDIRGLPELEKLIYLHLNENQFFHLNTTEIKVCDVLVLEPPLKNRYRILSPVIQRISLHNPLINKVEVREHQKTAYITAEDDLDMWAQVLSERLKEKAKLLFGEAAIPDELPVIKIEKAKTVRPKLLGYVMKGTMGELAIEGSPFWQELAYRLGVGQRNTYGFGTLE